MTDLPEPDPIAADRRRGRKLAKLPPDAACALCGANHLDTLLPAAEPLLEEHHVLGRGTSAASTVVLCRNCHAIQTGRQHDHDALPPLGRGSVTDSLVERIARALISLAQFVHELAHTLTGFATELFVFSRQLDLAIPGWREWESAR